MEKKDKGQKIRKKPHLSDVSAVSKPLSPLENNIHGDFRPTHPIKIRKSTGCGNVSTHLETISLNIVQPSRTRKEAKGWDFEVQTGTLYPTKSN
ncbi:hypothetical protein O181_119324 [Austropuccinia psidii MF-1]|uniref:Uncharacterized protein n=1 Tax=Austropuccinia psidii MF-1 TaxID=1389203 RepID=A0A9Q3KGY0_9BASI|nr:hypothetical protein [Austropuccinia psidii MF-1]